MAISTFWVLVLVAEGDPFFVLQASFGRSPGVKSDIDIFVSSTGNSNISIFGPTGWLMGIDIFTHTYLSSVVRDHLQVVVAGPASAGVVVLAQWYAMSDAWELFRRSLIEVSLACARDISTTLDVFKHAYFFCCSVSLNVTVARRTTSTCYRREVDPPSSPLSFAKRELAGRVIVVIVTVMVRAVRQGMGQGPFTPLCP